MKGRKRDSSKTVKSGLIMEAAKVVLPGAVPLLIGAAGVWLTPLRSIVTELLWSEDVSIQLVAPSGMIYDGDEFDLTVLAYPKTPAEVAPGILHVSATPDIVTFATDATIQVPALEIPKVITEEAPIRVIAHAEGTTSLTAVLTTKRGKYNATIPLEIVRRPPSGHPSRRNFTGTWNLSLDGAFGAMELTESGRTFGGRYYLNNGLRGAIDGWRDGEIFNASMFRDNSTRKWIVTGKYSDKGGEIEISGDAVEYVAQGERWVRQAERLSFSAGGSLPASRRKHVGG
jgi:hypothetical protein